MSPYACSRCGTPAKSDMNFCPVCGAQLGAAREARPHYMTVMFIDLVGFTGTTERIGNEAMFDLIGRFHQECQSQIQEAGGFVAKYLGDAAMAYFGYPKVMKDSAAAAVRCAHDIIRIATEKLWAEGRPVQISCGIATGWVVVNAVRPGEASQEALAIGGTVNRAARLQSIAKPNSITFASDVHRTLAGTGWDYDFLGEQQLKGFSEAIPVWSVAVTPQARTVPRSQPSDTPVDDSATAVPPHAFGQEDWIAKLSDCYASACLGRFRYANIIAPGGYGKTTLAEQFLKSVPDANVLRVAGRHHKSEQSFYGFRTALSRMMALPREDPQLADKLADWAPEGSLEGIKHLLNMSDFPVAAVARNLRISHALCSVIARELEAGPLILFIDDAHWLDEDSLGFLSVLRDTFADRPLMILVSHRVEGRSVPLETDLYIDLSALSERDAQALITKIDRQGQIDPTVRQAIVERSNGIPLYVLHYAMSVLEKPRTEVDRLIPETLIEALQQRLDISRSERDLVEAVAVLQDNARPPVASQMLGMEPQTLLQTARALERRKLLKITEGGRVRFHHALLRDAVTESMLNSKIQQLHGEALAAYRVAAPDVLARRPIVEANHLLGAGVHEHAVPKLAEAAKTALLRGEIAESVRVLEVALRSLGEIEDPALRDRLEMGTHFSMGNALVQREGFGSDRVGVSYARALDLCEALSGGGETEFQIAWGIWAHLTVVSDVQGACRMVERMDAISQEVQDLRILYHSAASVMRFNLGDFSGQQQAVQRAKALYRLEDHGMHALTYSMDSLAMALLFLAHGRCIAGDRKGQDAAFAAARAQGEQLSIPLLDPYIKIFSLASYCYAPTDKDIRAEMLEARAFAEHLGQPFWVVGGSLWLATEKFHNAGPAEAEADLESAIRQANAMGISLLTRYHEGLLAVSYAQTGKADEAERMWEQIITAENLADNRMIWPELLRMRAQTRQMAGCAPSVVARDLDTARRMAKQIGALGWLTRIDETLIS